MAQTILPAMSNQSEEWKPTWTAITSPPNFAERWAMRSASHWQAGMAVPILWLILAIFDSYSMWRTGNNQEVIILVAILGVISAIVAWGSICVWTIGRAL